MRLADRTRFDGISRRARPTTGLVSSLARLLVLCLWTWSPSAPASAQEAAKEQMQSLDEQVQEIKSDVLGIAAELDRLEEKLLYPSNTQVAVFVSLADAGSIRLDSLQIHVDGELVAHHIYSWKELEALKKGGVQRIYTGNVRTGEHRLDVAVAGKSAGGKDFAGSQSFGFSKDVGPKLVGVTLTGGDSGELGIQLGGF